MPKINKPILKSLKSESAGEKFLGIGDVVKDRMREEQTPLWSGPYSPSRNGGITYSMLSRFMVCRHKFWIRAIKGLKEVERFDYNMEYGNAWHLCEEHFAANKDVAEILENDLKKFCNKLSAKHPFSGTDILKLYNCCKVQFPLYVKYWSKQKDVSKRKPLGQEEVFKVQYRLPDGRLVWLRGKFDSRDLIDKKQYFQENKSKSDIKVDQLAAGLAFDSQSMTYLIAGELHDPSVPMGGVRYNCVRRPLSGHKYNIKQRVGIGKAKKGAESDAEFYERLGNVIKEASFDQKGNPRQHSDFFVRFKVDVTPDDLTRYKKMVFDPWLTQLCDWWDSIQGNPFDPWTTQRSREDMDNDAPFGPKTKPNPHHYMFPYGVYNPALEGRMGAVDEMILSGNERGFVRSETLFPELEV